MLGLRHGVRSFWAGYHLAHYRFDTEDDVLNFARQSVEDSHDWLAAHNLTFRECYKNGETCIELHFRPPNPSCKFPYVIRAYAKWRRYPPKALNHIKIGGEVGHFNVCAKQDLMLVWAGDVRKCPQKVIPFLAMVGIER